jgi:diketogulonate reductase-like aldo/keto reductase
MEKLVDAGLTKAIGISNFNINRTKKLLDSNPRIKPVASMLSLL